MATEVEKACEFFDGCHRNGATLQDILYYQGILMCASYQQLVELNAPAMQTSNPVVETQVKKKE
jgi:hypothetical protein